MKAYLRRICLTFKTILGSRRGFIVKILTNLSRLIIRGCKTLCLKREEVVFDKDRSQLVESLSKNNGNCLVGMDICFWCGNSGQKFTDCTNLKG